MVVEDGGGWGGVGMGAQNGSQRKQWQQSVFQFFLPSSIVYEAKRKVGAHVSGYHRSTAHLRYRE